MSVFDAPEILEKLAELEHEQWSHMAKTFLRVGNKPENRERWARQIRSPYSKLSEEEKEHDRKWARKVIAVLKENIEQCENITITRARF